MNHMKTIYLNKDDEKHISEPNFEQLHIPSDFEPEKAWELANLTRIASRDYELFSKWFEKLKKDEDEEEKFLLESNSTLDRIQKYKSNTKYDWLYCFNTIHSQVITEYKISSQQLNQNQINQQNLYEYKIAATYDYLAYYPPKALDLDRFGFIAERKENDKIIIFVVFRGTRENSEWFNNFQFKQIEFLKRQDNDGQIRDDRDLNNKTISLGFNKIYTNFRPSLFIWNETFNSISRSLDSNMRDYINNQFQERTQENIYDIHRRSIYQVIEDTFDKYLERVNNNEENIEIYITGHSLGGALATIAALHIAKKIVRGAKKTIPINLYSFASPKVGGKNFADDFDNLFQQQGFKAYRIANKNDKVTKLPLANFITRLITDDYQHVKTEVSFENRGRFKISENHNLTKIYCGALKRIR